MTLQQATDILNTPEFKKFYPFLNSFFSLTPDEQDNVLTKHLKFNEFYKLFNLKTKLMAEVLNKAVSAGYIGVGQALQIEDLSVVMNQVKFDLDKIKL